MKKMSSYSEDRYEWLGHKAEVFCAKVLMDEWGAEAVAYTGAHCYTHDLEVTVEIAGVPHIFTFEVKAQHATEDSGFITLAWEHPSRITLTKCDADYYMFVTSVGLFQVRANALKTIAQDRFDDGAPAYAGPIQFWPRDDGSTLVAFNLAWLRRQEFCEEKKTMHRNPLAPTATRHLRAVN